MSMAAPAAWYRPLAADAHQLYSCLPDGRPASTPAVDELFSPAGHRSFFNTHIHEEWRLVRKGTAPAFSQDNIRKAFPLLMKVSLLSVWACCGCCCCLLAHFLRGMHRADAAANHSATSVSSISPRPRANYALIRAACR